MLPFTRGFYVNQVGTEAEEGADLIRQAFGANYQRLAGLKRQYDPTNLFRHNQNIQPTVEGELRRGGGGRPGVALCPHPREMPPACTPSARQGRVQAEGLTERA